MLDLGSQASKAQTLPSRDPGTHSRIISLLSEGLGGLDGFLVTVDSRENLHLAKKACGQISVPLVTALVT